MLGERSGVGSRLRRGILDCTKKRLRIIVVSLPDAFACGITQQHTELDKEEKRMFKILSEVGGISEEMVKEFPELEVEIKGKWSREETLKKISDYDGVIAAATFDFNEEFFAAATKMKVLSRFGAGVDNVDIPAATKHGIWVSNTPGANAVTVAEHTVGLMLAVVKRMAFYDRKIKEGEWPGPVNNPFGRAFELTGKVHGQVGLGMIGSNVARMTKQAFNMDVLVYDPFVSAEDIEEKVSGKKVDMETLLEQSDVVTLNLPCNEETEGMFNYDMLKKMKKNSILINTARGGVIVEKDLARLVEEGWFYGVGLDVTVHEPIEEGNPLLKLDKVTLTGHFAAGTDEFFQRAALWILEDHQRVAKGEKPKYARNSVE